MGMTAPDSLLTIITDTSTVSGRMAACRASKVTRPRASGFKYVTSYPCSSRRFMGFRMA